MARKNDNLDRTVPKKKSWLKKLISFILVIVVVFCGTFGLYTALVVKKLNINEKNSCGNVYIDESKLAKSDDVINILLLGVDRRTNSQDSYRSDSMILLSLDRKHNKIKLTSFMRDSWVYIPEKGYQRLNAACTYGGYQLVMDTIEYNFNVDINSYVLVDFNMFSEIINSIGGIEIEVTESEAQYMNSTGYENVIAGKKVHLSGDEALWYARIRYIDSDFMRTSRQRKTIEAVLNKAKQSNPLSLLDAIYRIAPLVETDLTKKEIVQIGVNASAYLVSDIEQFQIPATGTYENAVIEKNQVLQIDVKENKNQLKKFIYE